MTVAPSTGHGGGGGGSLNGWMSMKITPIICYGAVRSPVRISFEHEWGNLDGRVKRCSPSASSKTPNEGKSSVRFQRFVELMPRPTEPVLASRSGPHHFPRYPHTSVFR